MVHHHRVSYASVYTYEEIEKEKKKGVSILSASYENYSFSPGDASAEEVRIRHPKERIEALCDTPTHLFSSFPYVCPEPVLAK